MTLPPSWAIVMKSGNLNFLESSGHFGPVIGLLNLYLYFCETNVTVGKMILLFYPHDRDYEKH